ncbi:AraC family transcriptional regulator [Kribbella jiaozuonensis]|uniref:HTH-type transcriptional regulator RipA n=1 Tax=Kribbella jiaozuonensis TaxID=2575441 RepID=A0A4U3LP99_9ACTN|nr:helix-turn-helix transcriptional regulator [Kribbella jiaozuonensis]TKK77635.1 helix-turn-helix transcriptional regulator [Kribbella jiaozuonensis]
MPETRQRPATTGHRPIEAGGGIEAHWHDRHQIVYAGRGVLSVTTDAGSWVAPATRAIWIPAQTLHQHRAYGETTLHTVGLTENPLDLQTPSALVVTPLLRELLLTYTTYEENEGSAERERLRGVLLDQLRRSSQRPTYLPTARDPRLAAVCDLLRDDPADNSTLTELGRVVGASERTLSRLCKADLGMSFPQWRTQLRLHEALRLLAEGESVTRVAHRTGWASASAFIDTFRRAFGHTPGSRRA